MSTSENSQTLKLKPEEGGPEPGSSESQTPVRDGDRPAMERPEKTNAEGDGDGEGEAEEEGECGFCLFMKGGGCRDSFIAWENCIEEAEKNKEDIVEKCFEVTGMLKKCMEAHSDYYRPILQAEKAAEEEAMKELEKEKGKEAAAPQPSNQSEPNSSEKGLDSEEKVSVHS